MWLQLVSWIKSWFVKPVKKPVQRLDEFHETTYEKLYMEAYRLVMAGESGVEIEFNSKGQGRLWSNKPSLFNAIKVHKLHLPTNPKIDPEQWQSMNWQHTDAYYIKPTGCKDTKIAVSNNKTIDDGGVFLPHDDSKFGNSIDPLQRLVDNKPSDPYDPNK
jgi:hypothetical protein